MGRKTFVFCDPCKESDKEIEAHIVDIAIRVADPNAPGSKRLIVGALEICPDHQTPITHISTMLENHSTEFTAEAQNLLMAAIRAYNAPGKKMHGPDSDYYACLSCSPTNPKKLKKSSLDSHARTQHDAKKGDLAVRPWTPEDTVLAKAA